MADLQTSIKISIADAFSAPIRSLRTGLEGVHRTLGDFEKHTRIAADLNQAAESMGRFADVTTDLLEKPLNQFAKFEHQLSKVGAVGDLTADDLETLKKQARELGDATRYSATEAAEAQENLVSAGYAVNDIMKLTPKSLELATAADLTLARSSDILTGSLAAFGLEASKAGHAADVLATGAAVSKANVEYLSEVTAKAGPIAKTLSISLETVAAAGAAFADAQIEASVGGTALRTILLRLAAPAKDAQKTFSALGLSGDKLKELQKQLGSGDLPGVLQTIGQRFDSLGLSAVERVEKLKHIFGDEAAAQATVLIDAAMRTDDKGLVKLRTAFEKADGAAARMAKRMDNDTVGALSRLDSAFEGLQVTLGEQMAPTAVALADSLGGALTAASNLAMENPKATKATLELVGGMAALAFGLKGVLLVQGAYHSGLAALGRTYGAMSGSLLGKLGLIAAVGAAGYAIGTWANETFGLADKISSALGRKGPETQAKAGLQRGGAEEYGDGSTIDLANDVIKVGDNPSRWPKEIREAIAGGAKGGMPGIAAFIRQRRAQRAQEQLAGESGSNLLRTDGGRTFNAVTGRTEQLAVPVVEETKAHRRANERGHNATERAVRDLERTVRRSRVPGPLAPIPLGDF